MESNCIWAAWKGFAGWYCKEGYENCIYNNPDSKKCAEEHHYGPDADEEENE